MTKKPYLANNWQAFKDAPSTMFDPCEYEDFMDWKVAGWEIPSSVSCIIRVTNVNTRKVKEYTYQRSKAAQARLEKLIDVPGNEIVVCDRDTIHHLSPKS